MKIEPPADDLGLQKLKSADRAKGRVQQVDHVEGSARIAPSQERREPQPVTTERRTTERRKGKERRQQQQPHPLDTREPHERRTNVRRQADRDTRSEPGDDETPPGGIDTLA